MNDKHSNQSRRTVLRTAGAIAVTAGFAGCLGDSGGGGDDTRSPDESYVEDPPDYNGWFDDVNDYNGTVDRRGRGGVTVLVGTGSRGMAFGPAAVMVSPGTTVVWKWTGDGGTHNVSGQSGEFESEFSDSSGHTFEFSFEGAGIYKYVCEPHRSMGMKGAVVVEDPDTEG